MKMIAKIFLLLILAPVSTGWAMVEGESSEDGEQIISVQLRNFHLSPQKITRPCIVTEYTPEELDSIIKMWVFQTLSTVGIIENPQQQYDIIVNELQTLDGYEYSQKIATATYLAMINPSLTLDAKIQHGLMVSAKNHSFLSLVPIDFN